MSTVKLGSAESDYFKNYDRKFIQLSRDICMLIHLFEKDPDKSFEDIFLHDLSNIHEKDFNMFQEAAEQFIHQLEGNWCIAFLEALRNECDKIIKKETNENSSNK